MIKHLKEELVTFNKVVSFQEYMVLCNAIETVEEYLRQVCTFSVYHGDFTPWNMFEEDDKIFVFDFEYGKFSYPPYLDLLHYFTQSSIFEKKKSVNKIMRDFSKEFKKRVIMGCF